MPEAKTHFEQVPIEAMKEIIESQIVPETEVGLHVTAKKSAPKIAFSREARQSGERR